MKQKSIRLPSAFITECEVIAKRTGRPLAEVMRVAMSRGIREMKQLCELDINCMDNVSQDLPRFIQQALFDITAINILTEDLLKNTCPGHDRFTNMKNFNKKVVDHLTEKYLNEV